MKIGMSSACLYPKVPIEESISVMKSLGFNIGEIFLNTYSEYSEDFIKILQEQKEENDFLINSIHAFSSVFEPYLFDSYKRRQRDMLKIFKKVCRAGSLLKANYYTFHGMRRNNLLDLNMNYIIDVYNELNYIANEEGIKLAQENVAWCMSSNIDFLDILNEKCNNQLHYTLDIKQAFKIGKDPMEYINVMGNKIVNVHINDRDESNICLLPGKGDIDLKKICCKLKEMGYNNVYTIEVYNDNYSSYSEIIDSKDFLQNILL
ncbi:sugar phosphate isomerase/epimerase [Clostridium botulinum]|nr:sugar phosphate isomerase/epimerase [Clostridium botulinum]